MIERSRKIGCALKGFASLVAAYLVGSVLVVLNGCVYVTASSGPDTESDRSLRYSWLPQFEYDRNANLWRLEFNAGSDYCRTGVYPPDTWVTGLKYWDVFGGLIECLVRLPTFPLEWVFSKKYSKSYAIEILDSNSKTGGVVRVEIPKCGRDDPPVLLHPMFRSYWGCAELEVDFPACERIFGNKLTLSDEEYMDALERRRKYGHADPVSRLERVDPVLMWKDAGGNEFLLVFKNVYDRQKDRRLIEEGALLGGGMAAMALSVSSFSISRTLDAFALSFSVRPRIWSTLGILSSTPTMDDILISAILVAAMPFILLLTSGSIARSIWRQVRIVKSAIMERNQLAGVKKDLKFA